MVNGFPTKRKYVIQFIEGIDPFTSTEHLLDILDSISGKDPYEYHNAISENMDAILDLRVGETLSMGFNRDNEESKGQIKRIA